MELLPNRPAVSIGLLSVLAIGLGVLAVLQYRWSDEVSKAERERMQAALHDSVSRFRRDFLTDLLEIGWAFRLRPTTGEEPDWNLLVDRYQGWQRSVYRTDLVAGVLAYTESGKLLRLDAAHRTLAPVRPPAGRSRLKRLLALRLRKLRRVSIRDAHPFTWRLDVRENVLFVPALRFSLSRETAGRPRLQPAGFVVIELNKEYLRNVLLPALVRQYFAPWGDFAYHVEVVSTAGPGRVIYSFHPGSPGMAPAAADARVALLGTLPAAGTLGSPPRRTGSGPARTVQPESRGPVFHLPRVILPDPADAQWTLVVRYASGSLDVVVGRLRRRHLVIGFGVLLLLAASVAMLIVWTHRAQRLAKLQIEFVTGVSHELRTPLTVIRSAAANLADGVVDRNPQVIEYGKLIRRESRRLGGMVEQVLHFAARQAGRPHYVIQPVRVEELVNEVLREAEAILRDTGVVVEKSFPDNLPAAAADASAVKQCLLNLVSNAAKYGDREWIGIRGESGGVEGGSEIRIHIEDRGNGIDPADLSHIFEPFYRGKTAREAQIPGTGLGLSLAKDTAESMGGGITVNSKPGGGSVFTLHLPAAGNENGSISY